MRAGIYLLCSVLILSACNKICSPLYINASILFNAVKHKPGKTFTEIQHNNLHRLCENVQIILRNDVPTLSPLLTKGQRFVVSC